MGLKKGLKDCMSILINSDSRIIVQGITGREGQFHTEQMLEYGTNVVAGVTPGKGGQRVEGVPVYDTVKEAVEEQKPDATVLFVPPRFTAEGVLEAMDAGLRLIITIAEGVPVYDMMNIYHLSRKNRCMVIGPNSFGVISPGKAKAGFMAHRIFSQGKVGVLSRSATNCYETVFLMTNKGIGQSTCIGVGGDMIPGSPFIELIPLMQEDPETEVIVLIGEIGGSDEEIAAEYISKQVTKPVVAMIAGKNAPRGTNMGHAGAIVAADGSGSAENKEKVLKEAGAHIVESTEHLVEVVASLI
jgi:succinyl-CoA synthetase alpha subunit